MPPTLLQQFAYQYDADKAAATPGGDLLMDTNIGQSLQQQFRQQQQERGDALSGIPSRETDHAAQEQQRGKKPKMLHDRDQDVHQQSINNLLLNLPMPPSPNSYAGSKYSHDISSPNKGATPPSLEDTSISDLFGLGMPRGSLMGSGQKEQGGQAGFDTPSNRNYYQRREKSNGYHPNSSTIEDSSGYYSNLSNVEVPSSPVSIRTPASPSTPGSLYSNAYSSVSSTAYTSDSIGSNSYNKRFPASPVRTPSYGRPIRGSPPYSDCSSPPSAEFPSYVYRGDSSRSNSPADSENSVNSMDGPLSDIMNYLSLNSGQNRNYPPNPNEAEKYLQNNRNSVDLQKLEKFLYNSHQQQTSQTPGYHHHHHHSHGHSRNHNYNQQYNSSYMNPVFGSDKFCCFDGPRNVAVNQFPNPTTTSHFNLDKAARIHRNAAATADATYTWSGSLPQRTQKPIGYSSKVFLGGVPWDITESVLVSTFKQFGQIRIEWPGKGEATNQPKGYVYLIFESEKQVKALLSCCIHDFSNGGSYYYKISSKRMKGKQVQVIPWALNESNFVKSSSQKLDPEKTVFVGALHGMMTAIGLAKVMNDLFDNVVYAGIDTDRHKYPIGSARVTFSNKHSFHKAIKAAFVVVKTPKFTKKVQVNPYIEDHPCSSCSVQQGPYFCRELVCFKYYCHTCWQWVHNNVSMMWHEPVSRGLKNNHIIGLTPNGGINRSSNLL